MINVLIVDDDAEFARGLVRWVSARGGRPSWGDTVTEAVRLAQAGGWDVVLCDIHFSEGRTGFEVIEHLKGHGPAGDPPPVLLLTGRPELSTAMRALGQRVWAYLPKPPDLDVLWGEIERAVDEHRRRARNADELERSRRLIDAVIGDPGVPTELRTRLEPFVRGPGLVDGGGVLLVQTLRETLRVLESTRRHFKSAELGQLRRRLEALLAAVEPGGAP